jgi:hypothetical protein
MVVNIDNSLKKTKSKLEPSLDSNLDSEGSMMKKTVRKIKIITPLPANIKVVKDVLKGRTDYPLKVLNILKRFGNQTIVSCKLKRTPVSKAVTLAMSLTSKGETNKRIKESPYKRI